MHGERSVDGHDLEQPGSFNTGSSLGGFHTGEGRARKLPSELRRHEANGTSVISVEDNALLAVLSPRDTLASATAHDVHFYTDDTFLIDAVVAFVGEGLEAGEPAIVIATTEHLASIEDQLAHFDIDMEVARSSGRFRALIAEDVLPAIMAGDEPDRDKFNSVIGSCIAESCAFGQPVRAFGELVELLALQGNHSGALSLEQMWNELQTRFTFALLCGYSMESVRRDDTHQFLAHVCAEHHAVTPLESYTSLASDADRSREIIELQQKAAILEAEITARKVAESQLQEALLAEQIARAEAEAALRQRDSFLALAAHDLRTPVTVLFGHAQLLQRKLQRRNPVDDSLDSTLVAITQHSENLSLLIDEFLDTSRLDIGAVTLERSQVDVSEFVAVVVDEFTRRNGSPRFHLSTDGVLEALIDPGRIKQVLANLLANAVKYSPVNSPVEVAVCRDGEWVEISVRDYGAGVPEQSRNRIFERYVKAHPSHEHSGLGLGLYIASQIVDLHGGSLRAEFPDGGGSRFVASLPAHGRSHEGSSPTE